MTKEWKIVYKETLYWKRKMLRLKFLFLKKAILKELNK